MNMCMVDVTDIPEVSIGDEAVLLGEQVGAYGREEVSAEQVASWAGTINYEVVARISAHLTRLEVP
jgi:alanine racemase